MNTELDYPLTLSLDEFHDYRDFESEGVFDRPASTYRLLGVSLHDGTLGGGHYTAVVRAKGEVGCFERNPTLHSHS